MSVEAARSSSVYEQPAGEFILEIRQHQPAAADKIEQLRLRYGTRVAYLAAFALVLLKQAEGKFQRPTRQQDLYAFTFYEEMQDTPDAIQLYHEAAALLLLGIEET